MAQLFRIHPTHPQPRLVSQAAAILRQGGLIAYPTDSSYAFGCCIGNKGAMERVRRLRRLGPQHHLSLVCRDLSELATYAKVDNTAFRLLKSLTPGPYTFILRATGDVPRRLQNPHRRTIGLRVPNHPIVQSLLDSLGEPIMSATLHMPEDPTPLVDPEDIFQRLGKQLELVIDSGACGIQPTTIIDLCEDEPRVLRFGLGEVGHLGLDDKVHGAAASGFNPKGKGSGNG